ncbi:MAG: hypothetical protein NUV52_02345 [Candidatus Roizmanbacteria bacterium]|nr:hypothetical protein [Candidatus Roizmanbacteria bacterium]
MNLETEQVPLQVDAPASAVAFAVVPLMELFTQVPDYNVRALVDDEQMVLHAPDSDSQDQLRYQMAWHARAASVFYGKQNPVMQDRVRLLIASYGLDEFFPHIPNSWIDEVGRQRY